MNSSARRINRDRPGKDTSGPGAGLGKSVATSDRTHSCSSPWPSGVPRSDGSATPAVSKRVTWKLRLENASGGGERTAQSLDKLVCSDFSSTRAASSSAAGWRDTPKPSVCRPEQWFVSSSVPGRTRCPGVSRRPCHMLAAFPAITGYTENKPAASRPRSDTRWLHSILTMRTTRPRTTWRVPANRPRESWSNWPCQLEKNELTSAKSVRWMTPAPVGLGGWRATVSSGIGGILVPTERIVLA